MTLAQTYQKEIDAITRIIASEYQPEKIILFGSAARGDLRDQSDIDLLIIKESSQKPYYRSIDVLHVLKKIHRQLPLDAVVMTPEEFALGKKHNRYFIEQVLKEGKIVYEA